MLNGSLKKHIHFYRANPDYGRCVAQGLGIKIDEIGGQKTSLLIPVPAAYPWTVQG